MDSKSKELGVTKNGNDISLNRKDKDSDVGSHEIGHALGIEHIENTIMSTAINVNHVTATNNNVIQTILVNAGIGKENGFTKTSTAVGTVSTTGTAPANFKSGTVVEK